LRAILRQAGFKFLDLAAKARVAAVTQDGGSEFLPDFSSGSLPDQSNRRITRSIELLSVRVMYRSNVEE